MQSDICFLVKMHSVEARRRVFGNSCIPAACHGPIPYLLTLPPPGTCFILSLEPHRDCTLLKSNFLSRICTWKVNMWGKKTVILEEATAAELQMRTIAGEENRSWKEAQGNKAD